MRAVAWIPSLAAASAFVGCASPETGTKAGTFDARHEFTLEVPEGTGRLQAWFAMPLEDDADQDVHRWQVEAPFPTRVVRDERGNNFLYMEAQDPPPGELSVQTSFRIERAEVRKPVDPERTRPHTAAELEELAHYLQPSSQSVIDEEVRRMAAASTGGESNPVSAARKLYDTILDHMEYHVKDPKPNEFNTMKASGTGSSTFAMQQCTGNCTDFHSLYAALARASGIPTRTVYGSFFKGPLDGVDQDQSYHCWIEFHAPEIGWVPLDVAVADIFVDDFAANEHSLPRAALTVADGYSGPDPAMVEYYFGNLDERRVVWHRERDLVMTDPPQAGPPLLWNPKAYVELDGVPGSAARKLTYVQVD